RRGARCPGGKRPAPVAHRWLGARTGPGGGGNRPAMIGAPTLQRALTGGASGAPPRVCKACSRSGCAQRKKTVIQTRAHADRPSNPAVFHAQVADSYIFFIVVLF